MIPADMVGGVSKATAADLKVSAGVLKTFKQRVDKILHDFESSPGSSSKVGDQRVSRASISGSSSPFHEADALHSQYEQVHERITSLSKMLGLQIEAMSIASHGAEVGFGNLEEEQRRRFWEIQTKIDREHQQAEAEKKHDQKRSDAKQVKGGSFK
ncbi:hypothetical protein [Streptomyces beihaiensis]|uniref:Uncharacterized protein n=1 Tax=Streptomyces beihaiensis TaxID=2984495 RepID=A0ABT3TZ74_9ACTN|nr:hypothetical protein [Streptomyces beihaiensis]MCX3061771.1 hypothetical protein [Streptomyces beihaiensis]